MAGGRQSIPCTVERLVYKPGIDPVDKPRFDLFIRCLGSFAG